MRCTVAKPTLHEKALRLFGEIKRTDKQEKARHVVAEYNALVQDQKVNLKPVLDEMDAAFSRGEVIGGATSLKVWCKMYKHEGVLSYARCRQIITGKSGHEGKVKRLDLDSLVGKTFRKDGKEYKITRLGLDFFEKSQQFHVSAEPVEESKVTAAPAPSLSPSGRNYRKERAAKKVAIQRARRKTHQMQPGDHRTWCGKTPGLTIKKDAPFGDKPTCRQCQLGKYNDKARKEAADNQDKFRAQTEVHTGQHEDCVECFEAERALQAKRNAANDEWKKRVDSLIRQWRQYRLRDPKKYRAEFEKAAAKYLKKVGDYGKNGVLDGRGRMEAAIATQGINTRIVTVIHINKPGTANGRQWDDSFCGLGGGDIHTDSHTSDRVNCPDCRAKSEKYYADFEARRTLTVVMREEPPQGTPQHVIDRVAEIKRRAALGLPRGGTCPNEEDAV
jgi:hypothetical protein